MISSDLLPRNKPWRKLEGSASPRATPDHKQATVAVMRSRPALRRTIQRDEQRYRSNSASESELVRNSVLPVGTARNLNTTKMRMSNFISTLLLLAVGLGSAILALTALFLDTSSSSQCGTSQLYRAVSCHFASNEWQYHCTTAQITRDCR